MKQVVSFFIVFLLFTACGYMPSSKYARYVTGDKISTNVHISLVDPQNTVLIKDAVDQAVVQVFKASLVPRSQSDTHFEISMSNPSYIPIQYDENGFVIAYRMTVSLNITLFTKGKEKRYSTSGSYDFSIAPNAVVTDQQRFNAIRFAAIKAISAFQSQLSSEGARESYDSK